MWWSYEAIQDSSEGWLKLLGFMLLVATATTHCKYVGDHLIMHVQLE